MISDLTNQGVGNVSVTNNGATVDNSGKLGKCYKTNGSSSYITGTYTATENMSFCIWVKFNSNPAGHLIDGRVSDVGYQPMYVESTRLQTGGSSGGFPSITYSFSTGVWYHLCVVYTSTNVSLYVNGSLVSTTTGGKGYAYGEKSFSLCCRHSHDQYFVNANIQDFRIYDNALSPKEVEILSRGLVVHHPLSLSGENLLANSIPISTSGWGRSGTDWTQALVDAEGSFNGKAIRATYGGTGTTRGGIYHTYTPSYESFEDGTYTLTARIRASLPCRIRLYNRTFGAKYADVTTEWATYSVTSDTNKASYTDANSYILIESSYVSQGVWVECCMMKFEKGDKSTPWIPYPTDATYTALGFDSTVDYDVSGYNYHGEKLGTITYDSDSPRYSSCTVFNGTDSAVNCGNDYHVQGAPNMTISLWAYLPDWTTETTQPFVSCQESGGFIICRMSGTTVRGRFDRYTASDLSTRAYAQADYVCELTGWHMITATYDTSAIKLYLDGVLVKTSSSTTYGVHFTSNVNTYIGAEATTSKRCIAPFIDGKVSDVRIYYTTLTPTQIAELYNTAISISNNGTFMGYELVEQ